MDLSTTTKTAEPQGLKPAPIGRAMDQVTAAIEARQGAAALAHIELVAEIRSAFERTGRPVPANPEGIAVLAREARFQALGVLTETQVERDYHEFLEARAEVADPSLIVARLRRKAGYRAEAAGRHAVDAEEYLSKAEMARSGRGWHGMETEFSGRAAAANRCAERLMAEAKQLKADADLIEREGLGAYTASRTAA